jgi:hypothetical protein
MPHSRIQSLSYTLLTDTRMVCAAADQNLASEREQNAKCAARY